MFVLQRVEMDVVGVALVILLVADQTLPITALPDAVFAALVLRGGVRVNHDKLAQLNQPVVKGLSVHDRQFS
jgi:hypothetical protein